MKATLQVDRQVCIGTGLCQAMAPELFERKPPDSRSDIFSFGALLYEMLTGDRAFSGDSETVVVENIRRGRLTPIPTSQGFGIACLASLISKCVARNPDDRWQSFEQVMDALRNQITPVQKGRVPR